METIVELPFLHDHHSHVSLYAAMDGIPDLSGLDAAGARTLLESLPPDRLSLVKGWRSDSLRLDPPALDKLPPVLIVNASLHGYAYSPSARVFIAELWPEFAECGGDWRWGERNLPDLFAFYGRLAGLDREKLIRFMEKMAALGIRSLEDMTIAGGETLGLYAETGFEDRILGWATPKVFESLSERERARCSGIKIFLDGSLGARSAALDGPFLDASSGILLYRDEELLALLAKFAAMKTRLSAHALGHRAIGQILEVLRRLRGEGLEFKSGRLEHVQFISEAQGRAARDLGLVLSIQPNFSTDSDLYADRLCQRHRAENNPIRMLVDRLGFRPGVDLVFGSDGMPHGSLEALRCCLFPPNEGQRLGLEEYLAGSRMAFESGEPGASVRLLVDYSARRIEASDA
ncbi:MAG: amidohydrolase family protein [Rectinemataceae bacterium]